MSRFNTSGVRAHEGSSLYARDARTELFLLAVSNMVGQHTFYENANERDSRYVELVRVVGLNDPQWTARFLAWLRGSANMRTASIVGAAEFVKARLDSGAVTEGVSNRAVIASVLQRADEPGELLAYWVSRFGRSLPMPVKRGIGDAMLRLVTERSYLKWDSPERGYRFADVLNLTHPRAQRELFGYIVKAPHQPDLPIPASLPVLTKRAELMALPVADRAALLDEPESLRAAGMTWEALSGWLQSPMNARAWEAVIPSMGLMALTRNLRNFDAAGVSDEVAERVAARLADPDEVARSRMLPMRFLSAFRAAPSLRWAWALEQALQHSLAGVPALPGRTLVLVDTSGSMNVRLSQHSDLLRWDAAAVFGIALASRCAEADIVSFSAPLSRYPQGSLPFSRPSGESVLRAVERWMTGGYFIGGGTNTEDAVRAHFAGHDRVVILTDEQATSGDVERALPGPTPLYTWNLAGHRLGHARGGVPNRHVFGGLSDQCFAMIPLLERGERADWPF
ncbi:TROVE domain-containing protein [Allokutzneria sp. NRRL B-24872]|uniref:TROVE domain-containing protein n=1 Tax=Allokutzneria sp. NRRL B-24872 TaxID=1137961 RepID=UPI000A3B1980|nr:TROVE domain-containing protein [Allokutzneria sp. NRRL B-24872]